MKLAMPHSFLAMVASANVPPEAVAVAAAVTEKESEEGRAVASAAANADNAEAQRYARQEQLPHYEHSAALLAQKQVGLIGVGGLGGLCALLLSNAGVGLLRLADGDTVAWHNLHRQLLFTEDDALHACLKSEAAGRALQTRNHHTKLDIWSKCVTAENFADFAQDLDLILDVSDDSKSRQVIAQLALEQGKNLLSGAVSAYTALIALFLFAESDFVQQYGCYHCLTAGADIDTKQGISGPIAASASALVAHVAIEHLLGHRPLYGQLLRCDLRQLTMQHLGLTPDPTCPFCRH